MKNLILRILYICNRFLVSNIFCLFSLVAFTLLCFIFLLDHSIFIKTEDIFLSIVPVVVYSNLEVDKKTIFKDNKGKSGVYRWTNKVKGDTYIGSATDLTRRLRDYFSSNFLFKEILSNKSIIYRALLKYGYSKFTLDILEYCDKSSVITKEQYYLDLLNPNYNICKTAGSSLGRTTQDHTRLKLRHAWLVRLFKNKDNDINFSEFVLDVYERKLNESNLKIYKYQAMFEKITLKKESKVTWETRRKILYSTVSAQSVLITDLKSGNTTTYPSARRAAVALNASKSTVMNKLKGKNTQLYKGRYIITKFNPLKTLKNKNIKT